MKSPWLIGWGSGRSRKCRTSTVVADSRALDQEGTPAAPAELIYEEQIDIANPLTGTETGNVSVRDLELRSIGSILASPDMQKRTGDVLEKGGYTVDLEQYEVIAEPALDSDGSSTNVVRVVTQGGEPEATAAVANAYAEAFVRWRMLRVREQIEAAIAAVRTKMAEYEKNGDEAAQLSTDYLVLQQRLRDLEILESTATGNFRVLVPATVPEDPVYPQPIRSTALGFAVGLFVAIALVFLFEQFDTRLRRPEDVQAVLQQPLLGRVPRIPRKTLADGALVSLSQPGGHAAEAFRVLRANLDFTEVDGDVRSIAITSCVQGEGKSVTIANLAVSLALTGKKVIVVDADLRRPQIHKYFQPYGVTNGMGLSTVIAGRHDMAVAAQPVLLETGWGELHEDPTLSFSDWAEGAVTHWRLYVMTSGPLPPNPGELVSSRRFAELIQRLEQEADIVLVDTPAMLAVGDSQAVAAAVDGLIFLVDPQLVRRPQLREAAERLQHTPPRRLGFILRVASESTGSYYGYYSEDSDAAARSVAAPVSRGRDSEVTPVAK
ncbi:MAG: hypothetical protein R2826_00290 [Thermoleophilia bacterium]